MILNLLFFAQLLFAGSISFQESLKVHYNSEEIQFELYLTHLGDERISDLKAEIFFHNHIITLGQTSQLFPKDERTFLSKQLRFNEKIKPGSYISQVVLYWKDLNQHSFETVTRHDVNVGDLAESVRNRLRLEPNEIEVTLTDHTAMGEVTLINLLDQPIEVRLFPLNTSGLEISLTETVVHFKSHESKKIQYRISNPGHKTGVFSLAVAIESLLNQTVESRSFTITANSNPQTPELPVLFTLNRIIMGLLVSIVALIVLWIGNKHDTKK